MPRPPLTYPPEFAETVQDAIELLEQIIQGSGPLWAPHPDAVAERLREGLKAALLAAGRRDPKEVS